MKARTVVLCALLAACGESGKNAHGAHSAAAPAHVHVHGSGHHHRFDDAAKWAKVFDEPARDEWQKPSRVIEAMAIAPGMTVADVGAGTGYFLPHLSRAVGPTGKVVAEDIEPDMVKWMTDRARREGLANVDVVLGGAADPRLPSGALDRILVVDTWHHVEDRPAFAKKLAEALKPGGAVFIVDFTLESPQGPPKSARLLPETVIADLSSAGLDSVLVKVGLPHQYVVRGTRAPRPSSP